MDSARVRLLALALWLVLATACASGVKPEVLQAWVGRPVAQLEREWGAATREAADGELRVLIYEEVETKTPPEIKRISTNRWVNPEDEATKANRAPPVYLRSYLFWVNPQGTIVHSTVRQP